MYKQARLTNGLKVVTHKMPRMQSVALGIWIKVGGRYESSEFKGIAHFLEHLLFKGTERFSCRKIKESIEGVGGSLNGFTTEELTCYLVKIPKAYLDLALEVLSDMVIRPTLAEDDIAKERAVILEEIKMYKDLPQSYVHDLLDELLWPAQPLGMSITGSEESVNRIKREDLSAFRNQYYSPFNIVLSAAGPLAHEKFTKKIERIFSSLDDKNINTFLGARQEQRKAALNILAKDTEQTHLALGFHGFKREHPLRYALALLHIILGANMSSRLFEQLREKRGLAYAVGTQVKYFQDTGAFIVHAGVDNLKVSEALSLILKELKKTTQELVTPDEFRRAKEFFLGQLSLSLEDTLDHMLWIGESTASIDKTYSLAEVIKEINKIKRQDITDAAAGIFREESLNLALIGPVENYRQQIYEQLQIN